MIRSELDSRGSDIVMDAIASTTLETAAVLVRASDAARLNAGGLRPTK